MSGPLGATLSDAALVCGKDLRLEWRTRTALTQVAPFVVAVLLVFGFALDADAPTLARATSGLFWATVVFAAMLLIGRSSHVERDPGVADSLALSGLSPPGVFLGKVAALALQLVVLESLVLLGVIVLYNVTLTGWVVLATSTVVADLAVAAIGALYGPIAAGTRAREAMLAVLVLPALAPVLLAATRAWEVGAGRGLGSSWSWVAMLGACASIYLVVGSVVWGSLQSDT